MHISTVGKLGAWSHRLSLVTGLLFLGLATRWAIDAWQCPTSDALGFIALMSTMGATNVVQFLFAKRDHLPLLTWIHALGFASIVAIAARDPNSFYVPAATLWGLLSLIGPLLALTRPHPSSVAATDG
jgi:polyferredoxin